MGWKWQTRGWSYRDSAIRRMTDIDGMQFSFVPGSGATDAILVLRQLQEKNIAAHESLYFAFVDLERAFDIVPRNVLWWALRSLCVTWEMGCKIEGRDGGQMAHCWHEMTKILVSRPGLNLLRDSVAYSCVEVFLMWMLLFTPSAGCLHIKMQPNQKQNWDWPRLCPTPMLWPCAPYRWQKIK